MSNSAKIGLVVGLLATFFLIYLLTPILTPFLMAAVLAYMGDPLVNKLVAMKVPRTVAASLVFITLILLILSLLLLFVPLLQQQFVVLAAKLPMIIAWLQDIAVPWLQNYAGVNGITLPDLKTVLTEHWQQLGNVASIIWHTIAKSGFALITGIVEVLIIAVVTFYLLRDWDGVIEHARLLLPRTVEPLVVKLFNECNQVLSAFFRGQLLVMFALAVIYTLGLWLVGLDLALLIGTIVGVMSIVPYLGMIIGIGIASIATVMQFHDGIHLLYVLLVFAIGHSIENMLLTPLLIGNRIGLHPVAVIFSVLAGGQLFGFMGVLLALPVAAVLVVLLRYLKHRYLSSHFYTAMTQDSRE